MGEPARIATATYNPDLEVFVRPRAKFPVVIDKRNFEAQPGIIHWVKKPDSKDFRFTGFHAEPHGTYGVPFKDVSVTDDEIECLFDPDPDWVKGSKFEYTIEAEFSDTYTSDRPQAEHVLMDPGDDKAVIRN